MTSSPLSSAFLLPVDSSSDGEECYEPEYEVECFTIADRYHIRLLAVVPPPLEYMMSLHSTQQEISGRQVWCGSLLLAHALVQLVDQQDPSYFKNKRILELGTGTGLVGMLVSKLMTDDGGVHDVVDHDDESAPIITATTSVSTTSNSIMVLTDGDEEAMRLLQQNLADPYNKIDSSRVKATFLRWNEQLDEFDDWCRRSSVGGSSTTFTTADAAASTAKSHRSDDVDDNNTATATDIEFDIILAGDVMYKQELPTLFFQTVQRYLNKNGGVLWLCHVPRATVTHQVVMDAAATSGFSMVPVLTGASLVFENNAGIAKHDDDWLGTEQRHTIQDCPREDLDRAVVYQITRAAEY